LTVTSQGRQRLDIMPDDGGLINEYWPAFLGSDGDLGRILGLGTHRRRIALLAALQRVAALGAFLPGRVADFRIHPS
jgi:hypothetical protein